MRLRLTGARGALDLSGPTICRLVDPAGRDAVIAGLGPDPLRRDAGGGERFATRVLASRAPIGALLMNQTVVAGVGNVYRAEALFLEGLHPERPGRSLAVEATAALWDRVVALLRDGVRRGAIVTIDPAMVERPLGAVRRGEATVTRRGRRPRGCTARSTAGAAAARCAAGSWRDAAATPARRASPRPGCAALRTPPPGCGKLTGA